MLSKTEVRIVVDSSVTHGIASECYWLLGFVEINFLPLKRWSLLPPLPGDRIEAF